MKVTCHYRNDPERDLTSPLLRDTERKFVFRLYSGDVAGPVFGTFFGEFWFHPPYPKTLLKFSTKRPVLPFISWRWPFTQRGGYLGFKLYGVDHQEYAEWLCGPEDVFNGSQALCLTFRPFADLKNE